MCFLKINKLPILGSLFSYDVMCKFCFVLYLLSSISTLTFAQDVYRYNSETDIFYLGPPWYNNLNAISDSEIKKFSKRLGLPKGRLATESVIFVTDMISIDSTNFQSTLSEFLDKKARIKCIESYCSKMSIFQTIKGNTLLSSTDLQKSVLEVISTNVPAYTPIHFWKRTYAYDANPSNPLLKEYALYYVDVSCLGDLLKENYKKLLARQSMGMKPFLPLWSIGQKFNGHKGRRFFSTFTQSGFLAYTSYSCYKYFSIRKEINNELSPGIRNNLRKRKNEYLSRIKLGFAGFSAVYIFSIVDAYMNNKNLKVYKDLSFNLNYNTTDELCLNLSLKF